EIPSIRSVFPFFFYVLFGPFVTTVLTSICVTVLLDIDHYRPALLEKDRHRHVITRDLIRDHHRFVRFPRHPIDLDDFLADKFDVKPPAAGRAETEKGPEFRHGTPLHS